MITINTMNPLKERFPNQGFVGVPVLISGSDRRHVFAVVSDHGLSPTKVEFSDEWPWRVEISAIIYISTNTEITENEGDWTGSWEHLKFLTSDQELIDLAAKQCAIVTNGAGISFITHNRNNKRPSYAHCE
jgi:predicted AlkP superfamily pyrophosphatase or phosphodiesterase